MWEMVAALVVLAALILLWVSLYDTYRFVVTERVFCSPKVKKTHRFVMLSDLHGKQYGRENEILLRRIRELKPDGILIVGDMLTAGKRTRTAPVLGLLRRLTELCPVYYANGNHEHKLSLGNETYGQVPREFFDGLKDSGVIWLVNDSVRLEDAGIRIYGVQIDRGFFRRGSIPDMEAGYLETLLGKPDEEMYTVLLAHNPDYFPAYGAWGADLVLSGHVHGGIMRLPFLGGVISPALKLFPKYDAGLYREKDSCMVLGRGLGTHAPDVRFFNPGELVVLDIKPETKEN